MIPAVRLDVIDNSCRDDPTLLLTHDAQWMIAEVGKTRFLPGSRVATLSRGASSAVLRFSSLRDGLVSGSAVRWREIRHHDSIEIITHR